MMCLTHEYLMKADQKSKLRAKTRRARHAFRKKKKKKNTPQSKRIFTRESDFFRFHFELSWRMCDLGHTADFPFPRSNCSFLVFVITPLGCDLSFVGLSKISNIEGRRCINKWWPNRCTFRVPGRLNNSVQSRMFLQTLLDRVSDDTITFDRVF